MGDLGSAAAAVAAQKCGKIRVDNYIKKGKINSNLQNGRTAARK
jgi:hypothetical protein